MTKSPHGRYEVDPSRPLPSLGGGAEAFAIRDHDELMAVRVLTTAPPRPEALARLTETLLVGVSLPVAHVAGRFADGLAPALICMRPAGAPLGQGLQPTRTWSEGELIACVLRPIVAVLAGLQALGVTHRAIRLDNVFQTKPGAPVTLGEAWSRPPAMLQPAWGEPPQSAMCHPAGRGQGLIADDVYALGALLVLLARGGDVELADAPTERIVTLKLQLGSYAVMSAGARLPAAIADLARGMLADGAEHRPQPALLADPDAARARRVPARLARRAQRPLTIGASQIWDSRDLARHVAHDGESVKALLAGGRLERWLRLALDEPQLGVAVEAIRLAMSDSPAGHAVAACHLVALLDPLAPLCGPGLRCWPDGMGPLLVQGPEVARSLAEMADVDVLPGWAQRRSEMMSEGVALLDWRPVRSACRVGGADLTRLRYHKNPTLACQGALAPFVALVAADLLPALDALARVPGRSPLPLDAEAIAFAATRCGMPSAAKAAQTAMGQLELLVRVEARARGTAPPTPALAAWLVEGLAEHVAAWPGTAACKRLTEALSQAATRGALAPIEALLFASRQRTADQQAAVAAAARIAAIDRKLALRCGRCGTSRRARLGASSPSPAARCSRWSPRWRRRLAELLTLLRLLAPGLIASLFDRSRGRAIGRASLLAGLGVALPACADLVHWVFTGAIPAVHDGLLARA